jgi:predicted secreted hydrolase
VISLLKLLIAAAALVSSQSLCAQEAPQPSLAAARAALLAFVQKDAEGFASASMPWQFHFPADHAAHPQYRTDSWRLSGSLADRDGRRFGFQLTLLRVGIVSPAAKLSPSAWAARDAYWGQLSLDDVAGRRRYAFEDLARAAMQLSGSEPSPARVWLHEWSVTAPEANRIQVSAAREAIAIEVALLSEKPPVTRSAEAFHAYFLTRLSAAGTVRIGGQLFDVEGTAWLDRAWGEVPLPLGPVVWDRVLLHLDDGREIMAVHLRRRDGSGEATASGLVVGRGGEARIVEAKDLAIERSDPQWRLRVPAENLDLEVLPYISSSGPARVAGSVTGEAYVEVLTDGTR